MLYFTKCISPLTSPLALVNVYINSTGTHTQMHSDVPSVQLECNCTINYQSLNNYKMYRIASWHVKNYIACHIWAAPPPLAT